MDIITSIIKHCRNDATLAGIFSTRIDRSITPGADLPSMAVVLISTTRGSNHITKCRVSFVVDASTFVDCESTRQRLAQLFHDKAGATLSDGQMIERSIGEDSDGIYQETDDGPWMYQEYYIFTLTDVY
jgi:hypothetical protein